MARRKYRQIDPEDVERLDRLLVALQNGTKPALSNDLDLLGALNGSPWHAALAVPLMSLAQRREPESAAATIEDLRAIVTMELDPAHMPPERRDRARLLVALWRDALTSGAADAD